MCGIVGVTGHSNAAEHVLSGLKKLEYRGYDSSGIGVIDTSGVQVVKAAGKITNLEGELKATPLPAASAAIGHTRWATHGEPTPINAHPHTSGKVTLVHNGIIENFQELREELSAKGVTFVSATDTETVPALINQKYVEGATFDDAVRATVAELEGSFALAIMHEDEPETLIATRRNAPLVVGIGEGCHYIASDPLALAGLCTKFIYLEHNDVAVLTPTTLNITDPAGNSVERAIKTVVFDEASIGKNGYPHFMLKEIHEQPQVISKLISTYINADNSLNLPADMPDLSAISSINIVACGTAFYAGLVGKYYFEQLAKVPVNVDVASEFRYRNPPLHKGGLFIAISQSGETADTLAALEYAKENGQTCIAITNTPTSSIARASHGVFELHGGKEIAVASTKAFSAMLMACALLALDTAQKNNALNDAQLKQHITALRALPSQLESVINDSKHYSSLAMRIKNAHSMLYLGRGVLQPLAYEGALKIKEITYIHAEAYASGEMKHGPIALVDETLPVVNLAASTDGLFDKTLSNMKEIEARRGQVILITDKGGVDMLDDTIKSKATIITLPTVDVIALPILHAIPLQLLAYHTALAKGTDVDQPRNLAKSVTVE